MAGHIHTRAKSILDTRKGLRMSDDEFEAAVIHFNLALQKNKASPHSTQIAIEMVLATRQLIFDTAGRLGTGR